MRMYSYRRMGVNKTEGKKIFEKLAKPIEKVGWKWLFLAALTILGIFLMLGDHGTAKDKSVPELRSLEESTLHTEEKIKNLCEKVRGVGETTVAVTLSGVSYDSENTGEICGIGIVCEGGDDPEVVYRLLSLVSAACGVSTDKIYIAGAEKDFVIQS